MSGSLTLSTILISYVALLFSLSVHEACHATAAYLLEDDTAASMGRMTLNPLAHIDPIGTVLFPLIGMTTGFPMIGWAKPVPCNPLRFTRKVTMRGGAAIVSAAGPASNVALCLIFLVITTLTLRFTIPGAYDRVALFYAGLNGPSAFRDSSIAPSTVLLLSLAGRLILINIVLAIFNLIPVGPLDGGGILKGVLSHQGAQWFERHQRAMGIGLLVLIYLPVLIPSFGDHFLGPLFGFAIRPVLILGRVLLGA